MAALTGKGLFRFALRWPDAAALVTIFCLIGILEGHHWACPLTVVCAVLVWEWRLGWTESYQQVIGGPVANYRRAYRCIGAAGAPSANTTV